MRLVVAKESDSARLTEFFSKMTLPGIVDFSIRRQGHFFDHYRLQSDDFQTLMLLNDQDEIEGMASLIFKTGIIHGEKQPFGYATDLRIAPKRGAVLKWAQLFLPVLEQAIADRKCQYVFSTVEQAENQAYNALLRPQHARRRLPRYYLLRKFRVVSVHGKLPWAPQPLPSIFISRASQKDIADLCSYYRLKGQDRPISLPYEPVDFLTRIKRWPGLVLSDFLIARDSKGRIIGATAPWNGSHVQKFVPLKYHGYAASLYSTLAFTSFLHLTKALPKPGTAFEMKHLTHLAVDHNEVLYALLREALQNAGDNELLCYAHFKGHFLTVPPKGLVYTSLPFGLYTVLPPHQDLPDWLQPDPFRLPPEFESATL